MIIYNYYNKWVTERNIRQDDHCSICNDREDNHCSTNWKTLCVYMYIEMSTEESITALDKTWYEDVTA